MMKKVTSVFLVCLLTLCLSVPAFAKGVKDARPPTEVGEMRQVYIEKSDKYYWRQVFLRHESNGGYSYVNYIFKRGLMAAYKGH
ncbi:MAG: hypothetical protein EOM30_00845 [Clostridia bacterium]|jgi:hypothetical protein|nr:hypothetical protein [Clostridia bacterium]NLS84279.1 hypothetical protein [Oscillospiraceae bacterium]